MNPAARIRQLRLGLMIHSYIYYKLGQNIIDDQKWDAGARELVKLQKQYPALAKKERFAKIYEDFDGSTGYHLAGAIDKKGIAKAHQLLHIAKEIQNEQTGISRSYGSRPAVKNSR